MGRGPISRRRMAARTALGLMAVAAVGAVLADARGYGRGLWHPWLLSVTGTRTLAQAVAAFGPAARERLRPHFERAAVAYPPAAVTLLAFKDERRLELWAANGRAPRHVRDYAVLAASGGLGPKLREGDRQVPEGRYRVLWLNPNSSFHLSLKLDYPNAFDQAQARREGRTRLGGDIFIHGRAVSIGCLAMGDEAVEELFVLAADTGVARFEVLIAPVDFRARELPAGEQSPARPWLDGLYDDLRHALRRYPRTPPPP